MPALGETAEPAVVFRGEEVPLARAVPIPAAVHDAVCAKVVGKGGSMSRKSTS